MTVSCKPLLSGSCLQFHWSQSRMVLWVYQRSNPSSIIFISNHLSWPVHDFRLPWETWAWKPIPRKNKLDASSYLGYHIVNNQLLFSFACSFSSSEIPLKISPQHQSSQTLYAGKPGKIECKIIGNAAQYLWRKVGLRSLPYGRVLPLNFNKLLFRRVQLKDAGRYECRAYSGSMRVVVPITVIVLGKLIFFVIRWCFRYLLLKKLAS